MSRTATPLLRPGIYSRYAWYFQARAAVLLGVWGGVAIHSEYILLNILGGDPVHVATLVAVGTAGLFTGLFSGPLMQGRPKRPFFLLIGAGGRVGLLIMACASDPTVYLVGFAVFSVTDAFLIPAMTSFYQASYPAAVRSQFFGRATRYGVVTLILVSLGTGYALEQQPQLFRHLLVLAAFTGAAGWWQMARVRPRTKRSNPNTLMVSGASYALPESITDAAGHATSGSPVPAVGTLRSRSRSRNPFVATVQLFNRDRRFFLFEMLFMIYGVAFMIVNAVIPTYLIAEYGIGFGQIAWAKGMIFHGMLALGVPLVVHRFGNKSPMAVCVIAFFGLAVTQVLIFLSPHIDHALHGGVLEPVYQATGGILMLYLAFLLYGLSMSGVHVVWNLASIYFAGDDEPTTYQGGHTLLVGVRGVTAPFLGVWIATTFSAAAAFITSAALFLIGSVLMGLMDRRERAAQAALASDTAPAAPPADDNPAA